MLSQLFFLTIYSLYVSNYAQDSCQCSGLQPADSEGHCIEFFEGFTSHVDAQEACLSRGGHLIHPKLLTSETLAYIKGRTGATPALIGVAINTLPSLSALVPCPTHADPRVVTGIEQFMDNNDTLFSNCVFMVDSYDFFVYDTCSRSMNAVCDIPTTVEDECGSLLKCSTTSLSTLESSSASTVQSTSIATDNTETIYTSTSIISSDSTATDPTSTEGVTSTTLSIDPTESTAEIEKSTVNTSESTETSSHTSQSTPEIIKTTSEANDTSSINSITTSIDDLASSASSSTTRTSTTEIMESDIPYSSISTYTPSSTISTPQSSESTHSNMITNGPNSNPTQMNSVAISDSVTHETAGFTTNGDTDATVFFTSATEAPESSFSSQFTDPAVIQESTETYYTGAELSTDDNTNEDITSNSEIFSTDEPATEDQQDDGSSNTPTLSSDDMTSPHDYSETENYPEDEFPTSATDSTESDSSEDYGENYYEYEYEYPIYDTEPSESTPSIDPSSTDYDDSSENTQTSSESTEETTTFPSPIPTQTTANLSISSFGTTTSPNNEIPLIPNPANPGGESSSESPTSAKSTNTTSKTAITTPSNANDDFTSAPSTTSLLSSSRSATTASTPETERTSPISNDISTELPVSSENNSTASLTSSSISNIHSSSPTSQTSSSTTTKADSTSSGNIFPITSLPTTSSSTTTSQMTTGSNSSKLVSSTQTSSAEALKSSTTNNTSDFSFISPTSTVVPTSTKSSKRQCNKMEFRLFNMCMDWRFILGFCLLLVLLNMICWCLVCMSRCNNHKEPDVEASDDIPELPKESELFPTTDPTDLNPPLPALPSQILIPYMPPSVDADVHIINNPICTENVSTQTDWPMGPMIFPVKPKKRIKPKRFPTPIDDDSVLDDDVSINVPFTPEDEVEPKGDITHFTQNREPGFDPEPQLPSVPFFVPMRAPRFPSPPSREPPKKPPRFISPPKHPRQPQMDMPMQILREPNNARDQASKPQKPNHQSPRQENGHTKHNFPSPSMHRPPMIPPLINLTSENNEETPIIDDPTPPPPAPFSNNRNPSGFTAPSRNIRQLFANSPPQSVQIQRAKGRVGGVVRAGNPNGPAPTVWKPWSKPTDTFSSPKGDF